MNYTVEKNTQYGSLEIYFGGKPEENTRTALKENKLRWNPKKGCWYGFITAEKVAEILGESEKAVVIPEAKFVDGGGLYDSWEGGKNRSWHSDKELKAFLLDDFKKAGIKATVRFNRAGYLTAITCTITVKTSELQTYEEWKAGKCWIDCRGCGAWLNYTDEFGKLQTIHADKFETLPDQERTELNENILRTRYESLFNNVYPEILRESASKRYNLMQEIVSTYNRDCSNGMVDYFDRDIYDSYDIKVVE